MSEEKLLTVSEFNQKVLLWSFKVKKKSVAILGRTRSTGTLSRELLARTLKDKKGGKAVVGVGFRFWKYGAYREYGAGRGYIRLNGRIVPGFTSWSVKDLRMKYLRQGYSEYRIRNYEQFRRGFDYGYPIIKRSPLPWLDPPIEENIEDLADLSAEFYGDEALRAVLEDFRKMMIDKNYGKK